MRKTEKFLSINSDEDLIRLRLFPEVPKTPGKDRSIPLTSGFYAMGWFSLAFSFPILSVSLGYGYVVTGVLGTVIGLPFVLVSFLLRFSNTEKIVKIVRLSTYGMVPITLVFALFYGKLFFPLLIITDFAAGTFWIVIEIYIGHLGSEGLPEEYSSAWGIPNLVAPIIAGYILSYIGFPFLFVISFVFFLLAAFYVPRKHVTKKTFNGEALPSAMLVLPMFFVGISSGFLYYVVVPYLKLLSYPAYLIGIIVSIPPLVSALTFVLLSYVKSNNWHGYVVLSSLLLSAPILYMLSSSIIAIVAISAIAAIGSSVAFSKLLAYISSTSSPGTGVFYYESMFGIGFASGSLFGGLGFHLIQFNVVAFLFFPGIIFSSAAFLRWFTSSGNPGKKDIPPK